MAYRPRFRHLALPGALFAVAISAQVAAIGAADVAQLRTIASRVDDRTSVITIEASDPVPYVASQPDPTSFVVELRDVVATGYSDKFKADPRSPLTGVRVETVREPGGVAVTRVRMSLREAMRPRVRSSRNVIFVEADRTAAATSAPAIAARATAVRDLRVTRRGSATAITVYGNGRLVAEGLQETRDGPPRVFFDLPAVASALPADTVVGQGPVERVRIGLNTRTPLVTRVVMDLSRAAAYRLEPSADGQDVTVVFDDARDPIAALSLPAAAPVARATDTTPRVAAASLTLSPQQPAQRLAQAQVPPAPIVVAPPQTAAPAAAQQAPAAQQPPTAATPTPSRFTGTPISLDFQAADLRAVLRTFADISGLNIVIDPSIQGTVDVALRDVPWDQALDIILRANRLGYVVDGTIMRVAPLTVLADEQAQRQKLAETQALAGELTVRTIKLSYARADEMRPLLTSTVLSARGSIQTDPRTNTLIISDLVERLDRAADLIATLDAPQPQVEIEARIVQTTRDFARTLGVRWGVNGAAAPALGNTLPFAFPNTGSVDAGVTLPAAGPSSLGIALGAINGAINLDVALSALERQGHGRLLSTPRVSTQNNVEAEITQGVQIPIQTVANNTVTVTFKDAALTLKVTPQITAADTVIMRISVENASPDFSRAVGASQIPPIDTQRAITQVLVSNGDTTVIGGIYVSREQTSQDRTPGLYRLPLLGWLFKRDGVTDESRELLIFITPKIIRL